MEIEIRINEYDYNHKSDYFLKIKYDSGEKVKLEVLSHIIEEHEVQE